MNKEKLGATVGARLTSLLLRKIRNSERKGSAYVKKRTILAGRKTYILDENETTPRNATLVREVIAEAQKIVDSGYNAKFGCIDKLHQKEVEDRQKVLANGEKLRSFSGPEYDLACQVIREAQKIISMGYNAKISCADTEPDKSEREKRREYYRWKRMNR